MIAAASLGGTWFYSRRRPLRSRRRCAGTSRSRLIQSSIPSSTGPTRAQRCLREQISQLQPQRRPPPEWRQPNPRRHRTFGLAAASPAAPLHRTEIVLAAGRRPDEPGSERNPLLRARRGGLMLRQRRRLRQPLRRSTPGARRARLSPPASAAIRPDRVSGSEIANAPLSARPAPTTTTSPPASDAGTRPADAGRDPHATSRCRRSRRRPSKRSRSLRRRCRHPDQSPWPRRSPPHRSAREHLRRQRQRWTPRRRFARRLDATKRPYSGLSVPAARAVWPSVDQRALARAFDGLASQRVALGKCDVVVTGASARATCSGSAEWTPKVGGGTKRRVGTGRSIWRIPAARGRSCGREAR